MTGTPMSAGPATGSDGDPDAATARSVPEHYARRSGVDRLRAGRFRGYGWVDLRKDVTAGLLLTALLLPAGMGYATASALPPETGLYATVAALAMYALVGPSRVLVLGPDSALAPLIAAAIVPLAAPGAGGGVERRVALAGLLALLVGGVLVVAGLLRLGLVSVLLSKPIRIGYHNGVVLVVAVGQLPTLLGFGGGSGEELVGAFGTLLTGLGDGLVDPTAAAIGAASLALIVGLRRWAPRVPGLLVTLGATTGAVWAFGLDVPVVGGLPPGLPNPALGTLGWSDVTSLAAPALGVALVAFADTGALSRSFAARRGDDVDANRELAALGAANLACGLSGGFPVSASSSRTPVAVAVGARTQVTGMVGAVAVVLVHDRKDV